MNPVFVRVTEQASDRISGISQANGYQTDIGANAQQIIGIDVAEPRNHPGGSIIIEAGRDLGFDSDGAQRQGVVPLEQRPSRDLTISVAQSLDDRAAWLHVAEQVASDVRKALFHTPPDWQVLGVVRLEQSSQESGWPEAGSSTLIVQMTFRVTYVER